MKEETGEESPQEKTEAGSGREEPEGNEFEEQERFREERRNRSRLLTAIQIIACVAVLAAALALRFSGGEQYRRIREWYLTAANDSLLAQDQKAAAKRTVIRLWDNLASAGSSPSPQEQSSAAASSAQGSAAP